MSGFADRVVEVLCDLGPAANPRWLTSSGLFLDDRHVLTAAHAVAAPAQAFGELAPAVAAPAQTIGVPAPAVAATAQALGEPAQALGKSVTVRGVDKVERPAAVKLLGRGVDLAILEVAEPRPKFGRLRWGAVDRDSAETVSGCRGIGYPLFQQVPGPDGRPVRDTAQLDGVVPTGDRRVSELLTLRVTSSPRPLPPQEEALGRSQ